MTKKTPIKNKSDVTDDGKELKKRLTIDIPVALHTKIKIKSAKSGETMAQIVCQVLSENVKDE